MPAIVSLTAAQTANKSAVTLNLGSAVWDRIYVRVPTMSTGADANVLVSNDGTNYWQLCYEHAATATSSYIPVVLNTGSSGYMVPVPAGFQYYKFAVTATVCAAVNYTVLAFQGI